MRRGQLADRDRTGAELVQHAAPGRIGERAEDAVQHLVARVFVDGFILNHEVHYQR